MASELQSSSPPAPLPPHTGTTTLRNHLSTVAIEQWEPSLVAQSVKKLPATCGIPLIIDMFIRLPMKTKKERTKFQFMSVDVKYMTLYLYRVSIKSFPDYKHYYKKTTVRGIQTYIFF